MPPLTGWNIVSSATARWAVCGGALYWTQQQGVWGNLGQSQDFYLRSQEYAQVTALRYERKYGIKIIPFKEKLKVKRSVGTYASEYWNAGIQKSGEYMASAGQSISELYRKVSTGEIWKPKEKEVAEIDLEDEDDEDEDEDEDDEEDEEDEEVAAVKKLPVAKPPPPPKSPAAETKPPAAEKKPPAPETKPPAPETKPPAPEKKPPAPETKPPATQTKPPDKPPGDSKAETTGDTKATTTPSASADAEGSKDPESVEDKIRSDPTGIKDRIIKKIREIHGM